VVGSGSENRRELICAATFGRNLFARRAFATAVRGAQRPRQQKQVFGNPTASVPCAGTPLKHPESVLTVENWEEENSPTQQAVGRAVV